MLKVEGQANDIMGRPVWKALAGSMLMIPCPYLALQAKAVPNIAPCFRLTLAAWQFHPSTILAAFHGPCAAM